MSHSSLSIFATRSDIAVGCKIFYLLDLPQHEWERGAGEPWERIDLLPEASGGLAWRVAVVEAGDVLYVPYGHGHYVVSDPGTVMLSRWMLAPDSPQ